MKLSRIQLENIGPITYIDFDLTDPDSGECLSPVVVFGINGSGKTLSLQGVLHILLGGGCRLGRRGAPRFRAALTPRFSESEVSLFKNSGMGLPKILATTGFAKRNDWELHGPHMLGPLVQFHQRENLALPWLFFPHDRQLGTERVKAVGAPSVYDQPTSNVSTKRFLSLKQFLVNEHNKWAIEQINARELSETRFLNEVWQEFETFIAPKVFEQVSSDREVC
jgi:hypothetical protein